VDFWKKNKNGQRTLINLERMMNQKRAVKVRRRGNPAWKLKRSRSSSRAKKMEGRRGSLIVIYVLSFTFHLSIILNFVTRCICLNSEALIKYPSTINTFSFHFVKEFSTSSKVEQRKGTLG